jgi:hypothetical protein
MQMIAMECHPYSTHTIVMACKELIISVAASRNIFIEWDPKIWIKDKYYKAFLSQERKAYNYFKHADRDPEEPYDGPAQDELRFVNEIQTLFNIHGHSKIVGANDPEFNNFSYWMMVRHPEYFKLDFLDAYPSLKEKFQHLDRTAANMLLALRCQLFAAGLLPKIPPQ